jgi:predicted DNA-binding ribbon-helix-helix protein
VTILVLLLRVGVSVPKVVVMKMITKGRIWGAGYRISIRLDTVAREALYDIASQRGCTVNDLLAEIGRERKGLNFTAATRRYVVAYYRARMQTALRGDVASSRACAILFAVGSLRRP